MRDRLVRAVICIGVLFIPVRIYSNELFTLGRDAADGENARAHVDDRDQPGLAVLAPLKLALFVALFIAMPYTCFIRRGPLLRPAGTSMRSAS